MDVLCFCFLEGISDCGPKTSFRFALRWWFVDAMHGRQAVVYSRRRIVADVRPLLFLEASVG